ncbi:MAG TPA: NAD-dependent deacylase [Chloroflexi bacterium]|nr:NAD-dependent deacylase [Chloroflexota bacterium]
MPPSTFPADLIRRLQEARHIVALTGAGISAESGIPTFREAQTGLWARYDPQTLASPEGLARNPGLVWSWYAWRRNLVRQAAPNAGHRALAAMERLAPRFTLVTQNVDGLHQQAGSRAVIELHGNIMRTVCAANRHLVTAWEPPAEGEAPRCPQCGSVLRPDVVFFGENLPPQALEAALHAAQNADVMLVIGTSGVVYPAAALPGLAKENGAWVVEINPQPTPLSDLANTILRAAAGEALPALVAAAWPQQNP